MKIRHTIFIAILMACFICQQSVLAQSRKVKETLLSSIDQAQLINNSYTFSLDMRRIAYRMNEGKKQVVVVDTLRGNPYDEVSAPVFSGDSRNFAYTAKKGKNNLLIVNHKQNLLLDSLSNIYSMQFSSDNKSLSYILFDGHLYYMVFHGTKGKGYDAINENSIAFSADGSRIAYSATKKNKQSNIYDGVEGPFFNKVGFPILSADGKRLAYWAAEGNVYYVIADNKKSQAYESVNTIIFSSDGKHLAYHATRAAKHVVVYDGIESEMYQFVHTPTFSPNGSRFVYAMEGFEADKEKFFHYAVVDGVKQGPYETVVQGSFKFSNNGAHLVFEVENHDEFSIIFDGKDGAHYSDVMQATEVFSNDNNHFAFVAEKFDTKRIANFDGIDSKPYDDVYAVAISPDNKKYVYSVRLNNKEFVVADNSNGPSYDAIMGQGQVFFDDANSFHYMAMKDQKVYLVEESFE